MRMKDTDQQWKATKIKKKKAAVAVPAFAHLNFFHARKITIMSTRLYYIQTDSLLSILSLFNFFRYK
jgi:hypothetical protein